MDKTAYELLEEVRSAYSGARRHFILARLQLMSGLDLSKVQKGDRDPAKGAALRKAIREICPDLDVTMNAGGTSGSER